MNIKLSRYVEIGLVISLGLLLIVGLYLVNYQFSSNNPGGNDFLVHYVGTRAIIYENLSPYSDEVALRIQMAAYGHPAQGIEHELRVAYPLFSVFLFAPFSIIENYQVARAVWMTVLEIALLAMTFLVFDLIDWKPAVWIQAAVLLFSLIWYHAVRALVNGNAVILIALMITAVFSYIKSGNDELAGLLLAVTTIKPHLVVLLILYILIWSATQKRWKIFIWFGAGMVILSGLAFGLIPNWVLQNLWEVLRYPAYNPAGTLAAALAEWFPGQAGLLKWGLAITLALVLLTETWRACRGNQAYFLWAGFLTLVISQWIGIQTDPGNFILLFPVLILIMAVLEKRWGDRSAWLTWIMLTGLLVVPWILFIFTIQRSYQPIQSSIMFIPVPLFAVLGLYWIRWWMISPTGNILVEDL